MTKSLCLCLLLGLVLGSRAWASKARVLALGEDAETGSYNIEDDRNLFYNISKINNYNDWMILEWGSDGSADLDSDSDPKASGGFVLRSGKWHYGAYLGNESNTISLLRLAADNGTFAATTTGTATRNLMTAENVVDLFIGSTYGEYKWGAGLVGSNSSEEYDDGSRGIENRAHDSQSSYALRLGLDHQKFEAFINAGLQNESISKRNNLKFDASLGLYLGGIYKWNQFRFYGTHTTIDWDQTQNNETDPGEYRAYELGVGHERMVGKSIKVYSRFGMISKNAKIMDDPGNIKASYIKFPLVISLESQVNSWLALRGSIQQNVYGKKDSHGWSLLPGGTATGVANAAFTAEFGSEGKGTIENSTVVSAGATLSFMDLKIDGLIGTTDSNNNDADLNGTNESVMRSNNTKSGILSTDNLLTRVSVSYTF